MKKINNLQFKDKSDPVLVGHNSCLIDKNFIDAYCSDLAKQVMELEQKVNEKKTEITRMKSKRESLRTKKSKENDKNNSENQGEGEQSQGKESEFSEDFKVPDLYDQDLIKPVDYDVEDPERFMEDEVTFEKEKLLKEEVMLNKIRSQQHKIRIKGIEFDWVFSNKEGPAFFKILAEPQNLELFSIPLIQHIVTYFWGFFRLRILVFLFYPFLIYFSIFLLYSTWIQKRRMENNANHFEGFGLASTISVIFLLMFLVYNTYYEIRQAMYHKFSYFNSFWNIVDIISLALNFTVCIGELGDLNNQNLNLITSIAVLFMYMKLFYFGRIFLATASLVSMVIEIVRDMRYFFMVLMISIAGFGN